MFGAVISALCSIFNCSHTQVCSALKIFASLEIPHSETIFEIKSRYFGVCFFVFRIRIFRKPCKCTVYKTFQIDGTPFGCRLFFVVGRGEAARGGEEEDYYLKAPNVVKVLNDLKVVKVVFAIYENFSTFAPANYIRFICYHQGKQALAITNVRRTIGV